MNTKPKKRSKFFRKNTDPDVYSLLKEQCVKASEAVTLLEEFMQTLNPEVAEKIEATEKSADRTRETLIQYLEDSFITPVSRHYLFSLSRVIDDLTDEIKDLKDFILFFSYRPTERNLKVATLCKETMNILVKAIEAWINDSDKDFWENLIAIKKNENKVKRFYWENILEIEQEDSIKEIITSREFCHDLNSLANKTGKVADRMGDLKIKSIK